MELFFTGILQGGGKRRCPWDNKKRWWLLASCWRRFRFCLIIAAIIIMMQADTVIRSESDSVPIFWIRLVASTHVKHVPIALDHFHVLKLQNLAVSRRKNGFESNKNVHSLRSVFIQQMHYIYYMYMHKQFSWQIFVKGNLFTNI